MKKLALCLCLCAAFAVPAFASQHNVSKRPHYVHPKNTQVKPQHKHHFFHHHHGA